MVMKELHEDHKKVILLLKSPRGRYSMWDISGQLCIEMHDYCRSCDACQRIRKLAIQSLATLVTSLLEEPFMKWGFYFVGPIKLVDRYF
jgi:hypothetical protein